MYVQHVSSCPAVIGRLALYSSDLPKCVSHVYLNGTLVYHTWHTLHKFTTTKWYPVQLFPFKWSTLEVVAVITDKQHKIYLLHPRKNMNNEYKIWRYIGVIGVSWFWTFWCTSVQIIIIGLFPYVV